jgi:hypothetical protein
MLKYFAVALVSVGAGIAIGASLPKVREERLKQREAEEKKKREAREQEQLAQAMREEAELAQISKMDPQAQVAYFHEKGQAAERRRIAAAEEQRRQRATRGIGVILRAVAAWRGLHWLAFFAQQLAEGVMDIVRWLTGTPKEARPAPVAAAA